MMREGMSDKENPVFLSVLRASAEAFARRGVAAVADVDGARVVRSVLMKPESEDYLGRLHERVVALAG
jgi:hypothetical protein